MAPSQPTKFLGWQVTWAAFAVAVIGWGIGFYGPPIFLHTLADSHGWPIGLISSAITAHYLLGAVIVANMPSIYRRIGLAAATKICAFCLAAGTLGWALADAPWQLFLAAIFSAVGWAGTGAVAINTIIAQWFDRKRPKALSLAYNGASVGGVILTPIWVALIGMLGFAPAALCVGAVAFGILWALSTRYFTKTPESTGNVIDDALPAEPTKAAPLSVLPERPGHRLWASRVFITYAAGFAIGLFVQVGIIAHLFSLLVPALGLHGAGLAASFATAAAVAGRTLVGWFLPPTADRRRLAAMTYAVQAAGSLVFIAAAGVSVPLLLLGILLFGIGIGNVTSLPPLIVQREFAPADVARAIALGTAISQGSFAFAPALFGVVRELPAESLAVSNITLFFAAAAALQILAAGIYLTGAAGETKTQDNSRR